MAKRWIPVVIRLAVAAAVTSLAPAADDTMRFNGTWEMTFPLNGQTLTIVSVHDGSSYKNYLRVPTGLTPAGDGTFSAADGRWHASADKPNDSGTYRFIDDRTVICTNSLGQAVTWRRQDGAAPQQPPPSRPAAPAAARPSPAAFTSQNPATNRAIAAFDRKDYTTAWREFSEAARQGDSEAEAGLGAMLFRHLNPPGTGFYAQCEKWLLASANHGNMKGMDFLAQYYYADAVAIAGGINPGVNNAPIPPALRQQAERRFALAREWFERASAKGDGYAMGNLAIMLDAGVGGPRDSARAAQLRSQVAGHSDAGFAARATEDPGNLAMTAAWQSGHYADALQSAEERAAKGDANAQALLGRAYYEGVGVARSYPTALKWLNLALAQNHRDAMFFLGLMNEHGRGVPQNIRTAMDLFDRAAALGHRFAELEVKGIRLQIESNRIAALTHANSSTEDIACQTAGGVSAPGICMRGGQMIDPWASWKNESH